MRKMYVTGINVLLRSVEESKKGSIIIPDSAKGNDAICQGEVVQTGPGFLIPDKNEVEAITNEVNLAPKYISLDVREGDLVFYDKDAGARLSIDGKEFIIVSYLAIKLFIRDNVEI